MPIDDEQAFVESAFDKANKAMHPVEKQWHYKVMTEHGFTSDTPPQQGFVRSYTYKHPDGREVRCHTGANADYWMTPIGTGYPSALKRHLQEAYNGPSSG